MFYLFALFILAPLIRYFDVLFLRQKQVTGSKTDYS